MSNGVSTPTTPCPDCRAPLDGGPTCSSCGLSVVGPAASRLWFVDQRLEQLSGEQAALRGERARLLEVLRSGEAPAWAAATPTVLPAGATTAHHRPEASPRSVQNTLLTLGALLLAGAGLVFAAVTYQHLGVVGRALILLTLTAAAGAAPVLLLRRRLGASAEAVSAVALVLAVLDAWSLRRAGVADTVEASSYAAVASGVLALGAAAYAAAVPLVTARLATVLLAQLPTVFVLVRVDAEPTTVAVALAGLAAVDLVVAFERRLPREIRQTAGVLGGVVLLASLTASLGAISEDDRGGSAGLLLLGLIAAGAATRLTDRVWRTAAATSVVPLLAGAAWAAVRPELEPVQQPLVLVAVALVCLQATALLPRSEQGGPVLGALLVGGTAVLVEAEPVLQALVGPLTWLVDPWSRTAAEARDALSTTETWSGTLVTLVVLAGAAAAVLISGLLLDRQRLALVPAGALLVLAAMVLPLGLATSYAVALVLLLALAGLAVAGGTAVADRHPELHQALVSAGIAIALLAGLWSVADETATLTVLPVLALLAAGAAWRLPGLLSALALVAAGAELAGFGAHLDLAAEQVGALLLLAPAVAVALSYLAVGRHRIGAEAAAAVLAGTSVLLATDDVGWLSWTLAGAGVLALAVAVRPDRRLAGFAGGLLLSASSWVRLADAGVTAPEPYVAPVAVTALVLGYLRRRRQPETSSLVAYGSGLTVALGPSLIRSFADDTPTRGLLLLVVAAAVVLVGVRDRLRATLTVGGAVVVMDALNLLAPYAAALPRWLLLAGAGALLVVAGATYEQRRRDVARLRTEYERWV